MKRIVLLRSNPKDASLGKIISILTEKYNVECLVWDRQRDYVPTVANENVHYIRCTVRAGFYDLSTFLKLFLFEIWLFFKLLFIRMDCVHAVDLDTGFVGLLAAKLLRKPFVYFCADPYYAALPGNWPKVFAGIARKLENFVITRADIFIITDLLRMPQHEGAKSRKVVELANVPYVDVSQFKAVVNDSFVIGYIGSLVEGRNLVTTIETVGELKSKGITLVIGGFGPLANTIEDSTRMYDNITFISWVPYEKLLELESSFDLFVYVTDKDNTAHRWVSPNKLFNSMAFGRPIIVGEGTLAASRIAAVGNGVAVPYGSKEELKKAILMLKENPSLIQEMGEKGRAEFERNWLPEVMRKRLLDAYRELEGRDYERN